jgi:hypothetical protein
MPRSRTILAAGFALLAIAAVAAPTAAADPVEKLNDPVCEIYDKGEDEPRENCLRDEVCRFTSYPDAGYPECVHATIWAP